LPLLARADTDGAREQRNPPCDTPLKRSAICGLHGYPPYMKVEVKGDIPVVAKTVADLCSLPTWPPGLILDFPRPGDRYPESVVVVERGS